MRDIWLDKRKYHISTTLKINQMYGGGGLTLKDYNAKDHENKTAQVKKITPPGEPDTFVGKNQ